MKVYLYTIFALVCFAFNSILCRLALGAEAIDAASFTGLRLVSGAAALLALSAVFNRGERRESGGNWLSAFFLCAYAVCFSLAYLGLTAATGALILFGSVQATMFVAAIVKGEHPKTLEWLGLLLALGGLVYLLLPNLAAPKPASSALMAAAGAAWGFYTLRGRAAAAADPLAETTGNFLRAAPLAIVAALPLLGQIHLSTKGVVCAVLSGAVASGAGYAVWYAALKYHTAARAAILQLSVPAITAAAGVVLLAETISPQLWLASGMILGGIGLTIWGRKS